MPGGPDGLATLEQLKRLAPDVPVVMMSGKASLTDAVRATKLGAFQFLEKPLTPEGVLTTLRAALELARTLAENRRLHEALGHSDPLVGVSKAMEELRALIARVAPTEVRVLVTGESGPGKRGRRLGVRGRGGMGGRGGEKPVTVDGGVIAATNKALSRATHQGQFREALLFRLNVLPIHILPLRERPEDIPPLVQHFAARQAARLGRPVRCDAGAVQLLAAYAWPGNVRELANLLERLAILATGPTT